MVTTGWQSSADVKASPQRAETAPELRRPGLFTRSTRQCPSSRAADKPSVFAIALIAFWALALATGIGTPQGWITNSHGMPIDGDYMGVYAAGKFTLHGEPLAAYDWERHKAAQHELDGNPNGDFYPWPYPPSLLFVAAALALLPYYFSMLTWTLATFAAFFAAIAHITTSRRDMLLMLAAPAAWLNLYIGQNGALTAALVGFGLILLPAAPGCCRHLHRPSLDQAAPRYSHSRSRSWPAATIGLLRPRR